MFTHLPHSTQGSGSTIRQYTMAHIVQNNMNSLNSVSPLLLKNNQREEGKNCPRVPVGCLTPIQTGRLTVGHNITLTVVNPIPGGISVLPCSWGK
jgi:hypothetical protein